MVYVAQCNLTQIYTHSSMQLDTHIYIHVTHILHACTAQKAMKDEKIESRLANETRNTRYVFHCSPVVKHRRCRLLLINRNGNRSP